MAIYSCMGCVPPKRYPGCHSHWPEYAKEKAQHEKDTAEYKKKMLTEASITTQKINGVARANRRKGKK